jgi:hypothetical protein
VRSEVFTGVRIMVMFFWIMAPCSLVGRYYVSPKRWHLPTNIHGAKTQNIFVTGSGLTSGRAILCFKKPEDFTSCTQYFN